jgi:hypothetical protein
MQLEKFTAVIKRLFRQFSKDSLLYFLIFDPIALIQPLSRSAIFPEIRRTGLFEGRIGPGKALFTVG